MADVFLSYSHEDLGIVRELVKLLERQGLDVWWDRAITVGRDLNTVIDERLSEARVVVVVWSKASIKSMWVRGEAADALESAKLVPIAIEQVRYPIPFKLCETAEMFGWPNRECREGVDRFLKAVRATAVREITLAPIVMNSRDDDPTLSVRVARRVTEALWKQADMRSENPLNRSDLEAAIADASLLLLEGSAWKPVPDGLLRALQQSLEGGRLAVWHGNEHLWGEPDMDPGSSASEEIPPAITSGKDSWLFLAKDQGVLLIVECSVHSKPSSWLVDRLHSIHRVLVHWRSSRPS